MGLLGMVVAIALFFAWRTVFKRKQTVTEDLEAYSKAVRDRHTLSAAFVSKLDRGYIGVGLDGGSVVLGDPLGERTYPMAAVRDAALLADGEPIRPEDLVSQKINNLRIRLTVDDAEHPSHDFLLFDWPGKRAVSANTPYIGQLMLQANRILAYFPRAG